jgi:hypothetical protein
MIITKKAVPRRTFLRGLGCTLALPLLDAMVPALSAVARTAGAPVRRLGFVYVPNGVNLAKWAVTGTGSAFEFSSTLSPLEPFKQYITVLSGLDCDPGESWASGTGDHARPQPSWLSATHPKKAEALVRGGTTIDQIVAQELGHHTQLKSLELAIERTDLSGSCSDSGYGCIYTQTLSWRNPNSPVPMDNNPRTVFERMFGEGTTAAERLAQMRRNRSILDSIPEELARLQKRLSVSDRRRVDEYVYSIRDVERRIEKAEEQSSRLDVLLPDRPSGAPATFEEHTKLMFDLQVLAYQADITRVSTFLTGQEFTMRTYPEIGVPDAFHSTSHHQENPEKLEKLARIDTYHCQLFSYYLEKLRATPDGDGNLLDHSMILYGGGLSDGNVHAHVDLPLLVAGGAAGRLKGGRHVRYPKATPMANLLISLVNTMGVPLQSIGDSTGPLPGFTDTDLSEL